MYRWLIEFKFNGNEDIIPKGIDIEQVYDMVDNIRTIKDTIADYDSEKRAVTGSMILEYGGELYDVGYRNGGMGNWSIYYISQIEGVKEEIVDETKPKFFTLEPVIDYHDLIDYINDKYDVDYEELTGREYADFWDWMVDRFEEEIHNPSVIHLDIPYELEYENNPEWVKEILRLIYDEYKIDYMRLYINW